MKSTRELREEGQKSLLRNLEQQRTELAALRVSAQTSGAASRLARIKVVRKSIARVLTVMAQKQNAALRTKKYYKGPSDDFNTESLGRFSRIPPQVRPSSRGTFARSLRTRSGSRSRPSSGVA